MRRPRVGTVIRLKKPEENELYGGPFVVIGAREQGEYLYKHSKVLARNKNGTCHSLWLDECAPIQEPPQ